MDAVQLAMEKNLLQDPSVGQQLSGHLYLVIQGTFCDIARYAGTVDSSRLPICCASFHEDHFRCNDKSADRLRLRYLDLNVQSRRLISSQGVSAQMVPETSWNDLPM